MAASSAMPPDAHAASCRAAGTPHRSGADRRRHGAEVPLTGEELAEGVADVDDVDVGRGRRWLASRVPSTTSPTRSETSRPSRVRLRAKSVWNPPSTQTPVGDALGLPAVMSASAPDAARRCPALPFPSTVLRQAESLTGVTGPIRGQGDEVPDLSTSVTPLEAASIASSTSGAVVFSASRLRLPSPW